MKPVYQTILDGQDGDCMAACIASLLELPIDQVPNPHTTTWWDDWQAWLKQRGLYLVEAIGADWMPPGWGILVGTSPRGDWQHACVALNGEIVHDPHPDGGGVAQRTAYDLLVPYDPADGPAVLAERSALRARVDTLESIIQGAGEQLGQGQIPLTMAIARLHVELRTAQRRAEGAQADAERLNDSCQAWMESGDRWRQRAEDAEASAAAQVALLQDIQSYLHGARYNGETLKQRIALAIEGGAGAALLAELENARAVAAAAWADFGETDAACSVRLANALVAYRSRKAPESAL